MKVGVLNFHYSTHNYGAVLQASALDHCIKELGYTTEHIDFVPQPLVVKLTVKQKTRRILGEIKRMFLMQKVQNRNVMNSVVFEEFRQEWISRSKLRYNSLVELNNIGKEYSSVVVGSDQVWRTRMTKENALAYFLSFVPETTKRISYAASFGVDFWEEAENIELTSRVNEELNKFNSISVRENSAVSLCKDTFGINAVHVLDPTLLVGRSFFDNIIGNLKEKTNYSEIVFYKLDITKKFLNDIKKIGKYKSYKFENIFYSNVNRKKYYNPVNEWLDKLKKSKLVVTDSFHCVCFSLLFEKNFIYYPNAARGMSRLESLLDELDLIGQICYNKAGLVSYSKSISDVDYSIVNKKINKLRVSSLSFLREALDEVE